MFLFALVCSFHNIFASLIVEKLTLGEKLKCMVIIIFIFLIFFISTFTFTQVHRLCKKKS